MTTGDWVAVMPVKRLGAAKSRLRGAVPAARHGDLALAMVRDTATAVLATPAVAELLVVTDDPVTAEAVAALGARVVPDRPAAGLNEAMRYGADQIAGPATHRAVLAGDLPALRPHQLDAALAAARPGRAFVADAAGSGTVLLAVAPGEPLDPRFGLGSAAAHAASGARPLEGDWPGLRQDVDTPADLRTVLGLGAGGHTCALLRDVGLKVACVSAA
ncbi:2-phospho-L-lactate guanylyltransferase [Actinoplanes sp. TRM 88003]|uniref:Phosphoenolpyruvate guanylyltransferase n=1 Tax=Paractinoplanes aksuensis TaxID=2939490 RepID=A0ABT1DPK4_9ACTN|nr:2-phospho-L-lactate guanylyltransferase [Actinoplanes aksuensis]MCO8271986.1 2-phospho-L-lactate guanylyltransferase [Actinoplanes aksuensis]